MTKSELIELLADAEHASWARWMDYLFSRTRPGPGGTEHISAADVLRWKGQAGTPYAELSGREKQADRDEVVRIMPLIEAYAEALRGGAR